MNTGRTRIEYLTKMRHQSSQAMESAQNVGDPWRYQNAVEEYNFYASELTFLNDIDSALPMPHRWADWRSQAGMVENQLRFDECVIPSPFNETVYDLDDPRATRMDVIRIPAGGLVFSYSHEARMRDARKVSAGIIHHYIRKNDELAGLMNGIGRANSVLSYIKLALDRALIPTETPWSELRFRIQTAVLHKDPLAFSKAISGTMVAALQDDHAKTVLVGVPAATRWVAWSLMHDRWSVDWTPFENMSAGSIIIRWRRRKSE